MKTVLLLHLLGVGLWLGCILVEVAFERALAHREQHRLILAELHRKVDLWVEAPAFTLVLLSGGLMLAQGAAPSPLILAKIGLGGVAIVANGYCIWLVLERRRLASNGNTTGFLQVDRRQHQWGAVVLVGVVVALAMGLARTAG